MGRRRRLRFSLAVVITSAVVALLYVQCLTAKRSAGRRVGIGIEERPPGVEITNVERGSPAELGGLQSGDVLRTLDGVPIHKTSDYDPVAERFRGGRPVSYGVVRRGELLTVVVRPGMSAPI